MPIDKGCFVPPGARITPEHIELTIRGESYHQFPGTTVTVCCLLLANGFTVVGQSACVDPRNFDAALGRKIAREDAARQIWRLEGYLLRERLHGAPEDGLARSTFPDPGHG